MPAPASPSPATTQARNPISLRLYKVLGTRYDDPATKEALITLSTLYATPTGQDAVPTDHGREDHHRTTASESDIVTGEAAARARKHLRRDMEQKLAEGSKQFLLAFGEVDEKLDELQRHIGAMRTSCDEAERQLSLTNESSQQLLERAGSLREEQQEVEHKKSIVSLFLARFSLTQAEEEAIVSRDVPVGTRFFAAMDKTETIRLECRVLMSGEDGATKAGLDIMAATTTHLEQGYEKLFRWLSYEFHQLGKDSQLEVTPIMAKSVKRLGKRPELLTEALTELSKTRQATLSASFLTALTRGGPSGLPRPIELHAHDPMRYIGDMLAWVHQVIAAEREFLESLFGIKSDGRMVGSVRVKRLSEEEDWTRELMDLAVEKLCVPLKIRVQQTIRSQESSIVSYKIANLLQFYLLTMRRTIGEDALLSKTLNELMDAAYKSFYDALEAQSRALIRIELDIDDPSLTPPVFVLDHAQVLREILNVYQSSLAGDEDAAEQASGAERVLSIMVDPLIDIALNIGVEKQKIQPKWDGPIFILNCISYLVGLLEPFTFTRGKQDTLQKIIDERLGDLTEEHYQNLIKDAGLAQLITAIDQAQTTKEPLSRAPSTQQHELQASLRRFSEWLSGLEVVSSTRLAELTVQKLHMEAHRAALRRMALDYRRICDEVKRPENKYEAASTLLGSERPFGQVNLLWQIFGLEEEEDKGN